MHCAAGAHKFDIDQINKGIYEVVGTLQSNGQIQETDTVFMGDNLGEAAPGASPHPPHSPTRPSACISSRPAPPVRPQTWGCTPRWWR